MVRRSLLLAALTVTIILFTGCGSTQTKLMAADNGKTIKVRAGDQITIVLEGNPSTGYTWEAKNLDTSMFQQVGETEFKSNNPGLIGASGTLTLTFKALKSGSAALTLVYHRPWETDIEPQNTFVVTVIAR